MFGGTLECGCGHIRPHSIRRSAAAHPARAAPAGRGSREPARAVARRRDGLHRRVHGPARRQHRHARAAAHRHRSAREPGSGAVGRALLPADAHRHTHRGRVPRGPGRAQAALHIWLRGLHRRLGALRARARPRLADRSPLTAGSGRGDAAGQQRRADRRNAAPPRAGARDRHSGRRTGERARTRPGARRSAARARRLAADLPREPPSWAAGARAEPRSIAPSPVPPRRRAARWDRSALARGLFSAGAAYLVMFGALYVIPYYLAARHVPVALAGLQLAALPIALGVAASLAGRLARRVESRVLASGGLLLSALGLLELAARHDVAGCTLGLALTGAGLGAFIPVNSAGVMNAAPRARAGALSGILNTTRGLGTALGVAVAGLIY